MIQIQWTAATIEEARAIAKALVAEGCVACANIISPVESIYKWEGKLEVSQEAKVYFKTRKENFERVRAYIESHCSYKVPEILAFTVDAAHRPYYEWVRLETNLEK